MRFDSIAAVEACYAPVSDELAWLRGLLEAFKPLDHGLGLYVDEYDPAMPNGFAVKRRQAVGSIPDQVLKAILYGEVPVRCMRYFFSPSPPISYFVRKARARGPEFARETAAFWRRWGARDELGMFAADASGHAIAVGAPIPLGKRLLPPCTLRQLECVSAHLVSALRLRRALAGRAPGPEDADAILDPGGRILHAAGEGRRREVRDRLVLAARHMDRARGRLRLAEPEEALALWQGLIDGTWSLVDHAEADGRRFILARRNRPQVRDPKALAPRERHVLAFAAMGHQNKYIGYLLGLAPSTVATHLESVRRKLGLASRRELIETFASSGTPCSPGPPPPIASRESRVEASSLVGSA